jgi:hypothetical protein
VHVKVNDLVDQGCPSAGVSGPPWAVGYQRIAFFRVRAKYSG